jgi:hypothetical protein
MTSTFRPEWWRPGMLARLSTGLVVRLGDRDEGSVWHAIVPSGATCAVDVRHPQYTVEPDLADPATVGALAGLVREVYEDSLAHCAPYVWQGSTRWIVSSPVVWNAIGEGSTEGAAWLDALVRGAR